MRTILWTICVLLTSIPAFAEDLWRHVATWDIYRSGDGCFTLDDYNNGWLLGFGAAQPDRFFIIIGRKGWQIPEGDYNVDLWVDDGRKNSFTAKSFEDGGQLLAVDIPLTPDNIRLLRYARYLRAVVGQERFSLQLQGTAAMLPELLTCSDEGASGGSGPSKNPFRGARNRFD